VNFIQRSRSVDIAQIRANPRESWLVLSMVEVVGNSVVTNFTVFSSIVVELVSTNLYDWLVNSIQL
jgi:hypothetical protein